MDKEIISYKGYIAEIGEKNYDNDKEVLVNLYYGQKDFDEGNLKETISLNISDLENNIKEYINEVYYGINQYHYDDRSYFNFVLGNDLLHDMIQNSKVRENDINYDFCNYIVNEFMSTKEYEESNTPAYSLLEKYVNDNKDKIKEEYDNFIGIEKIKAIIVKPMELPKEIMITQDLKNLQDLVDGHIECFPMDKGVDLLCNEEGKIRNLTPNRNVYGDVIMGDFILLARNLDGEDWKSLNDEQIKYINDIFSEKSFIKEEKMEFYNEKEVRDILKKKERLVYVDDGVGECIVKMDDIADFIVDYNYKFGIHNLKIYDYQNPSLTPIARTNGIFLDKCNQDFRKEIINRLIEVQQGANIKPYKIIDENIHERVKEKLEKEMERSDR